MAVVTAHRPRLSSGPVAIIAAGIAFALYAVLRPYADETTAAGVAAVASTAWVASHLLAMAALVLLPLGVYAAGLDRAGAVLAVGAGLVLPYYGAETFGLAAVAAQSLGADGMPPLTGAIRFGAAASTMFVLGLLFLAVGGALVAAAVRRRGGGWAGLVLAVGLVAFLPQFFGPPAVRIAHGLLVLAGCALLAREVARQP